MSRTRNDETSPAPYPASSVRRNLFSTHLSRRPASSQSQSQLQTQTTQDPSRPDSATSNVAQQVTASHQSSQIPSFPQSPRMQDLNNYYNSDLPNPFSPAPMSKSNTNPPSSCTASTIFPANSIVAIHPVTGRPVLPSLPTLPAHLRLSTDSSDPDNPGSPSNEEDAATTAAGATDYPHSSSYWAAIDEQERADKARIEKSLVEMMYRQRKRSQQAAQQQQNQHQQASSSSHRRTRPGGGGKDRDAMMGDELHHGGHGGMAPLESEELMGLVTASLRKKVGLLEEEMWMFEGGSAGGGTGFGFGPGEIEGIGNSNRYN